MIYTIFNSDLAVKIDSFGAELRKITGKDGTEYLCPEDVLNWDGHAPVLFPNTGMVKDGYARIDGIKYPYIQHGFAKTSNFSVAEQQEDRICFRLSWNGNTMQRFPFRFSLEITYKLLGNILEVSSRILNEDLQMMPCNLGFHPGFTCPLHPGEKAEDYEFLFPEHMTADRILLQDALVAGTQKKMWNSITTLPITEGMFDGGSFTMVNLSSHSVKLRSKKSGRSVSLHLGDYPNLVLWAPKYKKITNICIEPWYGIPDLQDGDHNPAHKPYTMLIGAGQSRILTFWLQFC